MIALVWNWYEVLEGTVVSLVFVLAPLLWRHEKHHREVMAHHEAHARRLKALTGEDLEE